VLSAPRATRFSIAAREGVGAHSLAGLWFGNNDAPQRVICVHGLTRNAHDFDFLAGALSEYYEVLSLDMPGRGDSDALENPLAYHYGTYVADVAQVLAQLPPKPLHWIGTSMGGIIGMMLCAALPGSLRSLTLNDIGCLIPASGLSRILSYAGVETHFASRSEAEAALKRNCAPFGIADEAHWQHLFSHGIKAEGTGFRFAYDPAIMQAFPKQEPLQEVNLWPLWEAVKPVPTLLLRGETSDILLAETALAMQAQHPALTLHTIAGCGHAPAVMADAHIALIRHWLGMQPR
jgi:pimeloyl-ACP methyl ester carboxylesterase